MFFVRRDKTKKNVLFFNNFISFYPTLMIFGMEVLLGIPIHMQENEWVTVIPT